MLKLAPKERVLINGAVIENGDRRSRLAIMTPEAKILRLRDAIHPEDAKTPTRRACFAVQLVLSGDSDPEKVHHGLLRQLEDLSQVFHRSRQPPHPVGCQRGLIDRQHYRTLKSLRGLLPREDRLMAVRPY